jgi:hypothetical protein
VRRWSQALTAKMSSAARWPNAVNGSTSARKNAGARGGFPWWRGRMRAVAVGISVTETSSDRPTEQLMARAMSRKSCPASSSTNSTGRKTASVVAVEATTAPHTSRVPSTAAWNRRAPAW